jgi:hypothetical protein
VHQQAGRVGLLDQRGDLGRPAVGVAADDLVLLRADRVGVTGDLGQPAGVIRSA